MTIFKRKIRLLLIVPGAVGLSGLITWWMGGVGFFLNHAMDNALRSRDYERAERILEWIDSMGSRTPETLFLTARLRRKELRITEVSALLKQAADAGVDPHLLKREYTLLEAQTGRIRSVVDELNQLLQDTPEDGADICEVYVNGSMMIGAVDVAMTIIPVWKQEFPNDPQPHYALARVFEYQEAIDRALAELDIAVSKNPEHWPSRYLRGRILFGENRIDAALADMDAASKMKSNSAPLFQKARCLRSLSRLQDAHQILRQLASRRAEDVRFSFALVSEPERGRPIEYELGTLEAALGNHAEARKWLEVVLREEPNHLDARYAWALSLRELGQTAEAEQAIAAVQEIRTKLQEIDRLVDEIQRHPEQPQLEARCRVGELFLKYENARHGEFWVHEALNRDPNYAPAHRLLAEYYSELARTEPAWKTLAEEHRIASEKASGPTAAGTPK